MREIDVRNLEMLGQAVLQIHLGDGAHVDEHAAELAASLSLLDERGGKLLLGDQFLLEQEIS